MRQCLCVTPVEGVVEVEEVRRRLVEGSGSSWEATRVSWPSFLAVGDEERRVELSSTFR